MWEVRVKWGAATATTPLQGRVTDERGDAGITVNKGRRGAQQAERRRKPPSGARRREDRF